MANTQMTEFSKYAVIKGPALPPLLECQDTRIVGVIHPFFVTNHHRNTDRRNVFLSSMKASYMNTEDGLRMEGELRAADRALEIIEREAKNPHSILLLVGYATTESDYRTLAEGKNKTLFKTHPETIFADGEKDEIYSGMVRSSGFNGPFDELWFMSKALDIMGAERTVFFERNVDQNALYDIFNGVDRAMIRGVFMGSYATQCVKGVRNDLCDTLNIPYDRMTVRDSASTDSIIPSHAQRVEIKKFAVDKKWEDTTRNAVSMRRHGLPSGFVMGSQLFSPSSIKTFLLNPEYMEGTFSPFRLQNLEKAMLGLRHKEGKNNRTHFPMEPDNLSTVIDFLNSEKGFDRRRYRDEEIRPWHATDDEIITFQRRLANYLNGGSVLEELAITEKFSSRYKTEVNHLAKRIQSDNEQTPK